MLRTPTRLNDQSDHSKIPFTEYIHQPSVIPTIRHPVLVRPGTRLCLHQPLKTPRHARKNPSA